MTSSEPLNVILQVDAAGAPVRIEYVQAGVRYEAAPTSRHQKAVRRIERSIEPVPGGCTGFALADVLLRFPDHSLKRPDLAIFCSEPPDLDEALDVLPAAVVEVLSPGYAEKDLGKDGALFYLAHGVLDVIVVDPRRFEVWHYQPGATVQHHRSPRVIELTCGCRCTV